MCDPDKRTRMSDELDERLLLVETVNEEKVRRHIRMYLRLTGQWFPHKSSWKGKILYALWQLVVMVGVLIYFIYTLGVWGARRNEIMKDFVYYPITTIERAMWEFRWLVTGYLGIIFYNNVIREFLENKDVTLTDTAWKDVRHVLWALEILLAFISVVTIVCYLGEIDYVVSSDKVPGISLDAIFIFLDRLFVFPLFLAFCLVVYILGSMAKRYCEDIKHWTSGENEARKEFGKIKKCVRSAGLTFQLYLLIHFLMLYCTFFLGVCSCFEQMEVRISENITITSPFLISHYGRVVTFGSNSSTETLLTTFVDANQTNGKGMNIGAMEGSEELFETKWLKRSMKMIAIDMVVKTFESLFLYLVPVWLMTRLQNQLRCVCEAIEDCKCEEQESNNGLFIDVDKIRTMCKYVKTARGLEVFGHTVPAFVAFILAAFGPFVAVILQRLFSYIHLKK